MNIKSFIIGALAVSTVALTGCTENVAYDDNTVSGRSVDRNAGIGRSVRRDDRMITSYDGRDGRMITSRDGRDGRMVTSRDDRTISSRP